MKLWPTTHPMSEVDHQISEGFSPNTHCPVLLIHTWYPPCTCTASCGFAVVPEVARINSGSEDSITSHSDETDLPCSRKSSHLSKSGGECSCCFPSSILALFKTTNL